MAIISAEDGTELIFESGGGHLLTEDDNSMIATRTTSNGRKCFILWFEDEDEL